MVLVEISGRLDLNLPTRPHILAARLIAAGDMRASGFNAARSFARRIYV